MNIRHEKLIKLCLWLLNSLRESEMGYIYRLWKAKGWDSVRLHLNEKDRSHAHILSSNPPAVLLTYGRDDSRLHKSLRAKNLTVLYVFFWDITDSIKEISTSIHKTLKNYPHHRIICLCNEANQPSKFSDYGIEAIFFNHNALVNESIFNITAKTYKPVKKWDAIYNATLSPYKRHDLAKSINNLCLVYYRYSGSYDSVYEKKIRAFIPNAFWANDELNNGDKFKAVELIDLLSDAHCGLCLSDTEGAMFASVEYLLCGLPVVSTPSRGGRDVFFNDDNSLICQPNPDAVSGAVNTWLQREINPDLVRSSTLSIVYQHRERLNDLLSAIGIRANMPWSPMFRFMHLNNVAKEIKMCGH